MQRDGTPITVKIDPLYREADESLIVSGVGSTVKGFGGNDQFTITGSNANIDGGRGIDTAIYHGAITEFSVTSSAGALSLTRGNSTDTLRNIELFQFDDANLSAASLANLDNPDAIFRFYNESTGVHFYTASAIEADGLIRQPGDFTYDGISFSQAHSPSEEATEIYRFYNLDTQSHFYTASAAEKDFLIENHHQFAFEGVAYFAHLSPGENTTELYRFFNTSTGSHFYTASQAEMEQVKIELAGVYSFEGVAYYVEVA